MRVYDKKIRYVLRGPWMKTRNSFSILKDVIQDDGKRIHELVKDDRIQALNRDFKAGGIDIHQATLVLREIKKDLEKDLRILRGDRPLSIENQQILDEYIRRKIDIKTASTPGHRTSERSYAKKTFELLGNYSLRTVSIEVIQNILDMQKSRGGNRQLLRTFRKLLKHVGRHDVAEHLHRKKFPQYKPPYLEPWQVDVLVNEMPESWLKRLPLMRELIKIIYNLGLRLSEALALEKGDVRRADGEIVFAVERQWVRHSHTDQHHPRLRPTKNKSKRLVLPIDAKETLACLERWLKAYPKVEQREIYRYEISRYIRETCRERFKIEIDEDTPGTDSFFDLANLPDAEDDRVYKATHMLRASHAVYMMAKMGNEYFVANQIGDTPEVVREHYAGRTNKSMTIAEAARLLKIRNEEEGGKRK